MHIQLVKRLTFITMLLCYVKVANAQPYKRAANLYLKKDLTGALIEARKEYLNYKTDPLLNLIIGRILVDKFNISEGIPYLQYANAFPDVPSTKAWAQAYLGFCYWLQQKPDVAKLYLDSCIDAHVTTNVVKYAMQVYNLTGLDSIKFSFIIRETQDIIFHFELKSFRVINDTAQFIAAYQNAFNSIAAYFGNKLPKKIDLYVWGDEEEAKRILSKELAYAESEWYLIHTSPSHTKGHELCHIISYYASSHSKHQTKLINEGTAVYFDQTNRNRHGAAKKALTRAKIDSLSVRALWEHLGMQEEVLYPVGGAFVETLILKGGKEKYLQLLADQRYSSAQKIYGDQLDEIIAWFEKELNGPSEN